VDRPGPFLYARGWPELVTGSTPAAGSGFTLTNPGQFGWLLTCATFRLVTDANVANRFVTLDYDDGNGVIFCRNTFPQAVTASTTAVFSFQADRGSSDWSANNDASLPLKAHFFEPGQKVQVNIANVQAGDQIDRIRLIMERFPSGPQGFVQELLDRFERVGT
jgi:hypothetical protein